MAEPGELPRQEPDSFRLACGAEKTNLRTGWYSISDGSFHPEPPPGINFSPGVGTEIDWLSGEALLFPRDKGTTLIVGRNSELKIDADLVNTSKLLSQYSGETTEKVAEYVDTLKDLDNVVKQLTGEGVEQVADFGDLGVSRHHLQMSNHPEGVTIVSYDPSLGTRPEHYSKPKSARLNYPIILRQYPKEPLAHKLNWTVFEGSLTLRDGDVVIVDGEKRKYCFRFFSAKEDKPSMFIKQVYSPGTTLEELHKQLIVPYDSHKKLTSENNGK